jgi:hypothetical protein
MQPSKEALERFREIYREKYSREVTPDTILELATRVMTLYELLACPLPGEVADRQTK